MEMKYIEEKVNVNESKSYIKDTHISKGNR